jgi:hypothetical protein
MFNFTWNVVELCGRASKIKPLQIIGIKAYKTFHFVQGFNTLGYSPDIEHMRILDDVFDQGLLSWISVNISNQTHVDFDKVRLNSQKGQLI